MRDRRVSYDTCSARSTDLHEHSAKISKSHHFLQLFPLLETVEFVVLSLYAGEDETMALVGVG